MGLKLAAASGGSIELAPTNTASNFTVTVPAATGTVLLNNSSDQTINGLTVGKGAGDVSTNTAVGASALAANTTSEANTVVGYQAGQVSNGTFGGNSFFGYQSGKASTTAYGCSFFGEASGLSNTTGVSNTAIGGSALRANTTASENTAVGYQAGYSNTTGGSNTATGYQALYTNSSGSYNTATGWRSLYLSTTASYNTAYGYASLYSNTTGAYNVALGMQALTANTTASYNTAVGYQALPSSTTADSNTAVGYRAGYSVTTGYENICIGKNAGFSDGAVSGGANLTTGGDNVYIGYYAVPSASNVAAELVIGASGSGAVGKGANTGFIKGGSGGIYQGNNSSSWSVTSDRRLKKNIVDFTAGLEKLLQLQVRNFEYRLPEEVEELNPTCAIEREGVQIGVIAQEIQQVLPDCVKQESTGVLSVDSDNLTWYLVKAIQELKAEIDILKGQA